MFQYGWQHGCLQEARLETLSFM